MTVTSLFSMRGEPDFHQELDRLSRKSSLQPFNDQALAFVGEVSSRLLHSNIARQYPELAALGQWFRPARLRSMAVKANSAERTCTKARGLVFIISPSNVDVMFIYGWFLSILCGNSTIVRMSQKSGAIREVFLTLVRELAREVRFQKLLSHSWLITYEHGSTATRNISAVCDARLIWGGDSSVLNIRAIPLNPLAVEVAFPDRFSLAAFSAQAIKDATEENIGKIAYRFANDTLWFSQQACSSPRVVFWIGSDDEIQQQRQRFWAKYIESASTFENEAAAAMSRTANLFTLAANGLISRAESDLGELPTLARGTRLNAELREMHAGFGLFVEYNLSSLEQLAGYIKSKDQTLVAYGFSRVEIKQLVESVPNRGLDRVVRPGQATDFDYLWDGMDLLQVLLRSVSLSVQET